MLVLIEQVLQASIECNNMCLSCLGPKSAVFSLLLISGHSTYISLDCSVMNLVLGFVSHMAILGI